MNIRPFLLAGLAAAALLSACHKGSAVDPEGQGAVRLSVIPIWNGAPFDRMQVYLNAADQREQIQLVKFYLARMTLVAPDVEHELFDADLFNITNGPETRILPVPAGDYQQLRFGLGLPPDLNHTDIATVPVNDPLGNNSGMYWTWATMYRFLLFEGRFDNDPQATGLLPFQFSWHTGLDTLYRERDLPLALEVPAGDTVDLPLYVDLARFTTDGADTLSFADIAQFHGEVQSLPLGIRIADLEQGAFRTP